MKTSSVEPSNRVQGIQWGYLVEADAAPGPVGTVLCVPVKRI
jgi:hypothetical protein